MLPIEVVKDDCYHEDPDNSGYCIKCGLEGEKWDWDKMDELELNDIPIGVCRKGGEMSEPIQERQDVMHFSIHEEPNGDWVLRLNAANGSYSGLGSFNGKLEAETIRDVLQGSLELAHVVEIGKDGTLFNVAEGRTRSWMRGMKNANNMVEGRRLRELL